MYNFHAATEVERLEHQHRIAEAERLGWLRIDLCSPRRSLRARLHRAPQTATASPVERRPGLQPSDPEPLDLTKPFSTAGDGDSVASEHPHLVDSIR
jgi:hypothetical protein